MFTVTFTYWAWGDVSIEVEVGDIHFTFDDLQAPELAQVLMEAFANRAKLVLTQKMSEVYVYNEGLS